MIEFRSLAILKVASLAALVALFGCAEKGSEQVANDQEASQMVLRGDLSSTYTNGQFAVWTRKAKGAAGAMSMATSSMSKNTGADEGHLAGLNVLANVPIAADGSIELVIPVVEPRQVYFYVIGSTSAEGMPMGPVKGQNFILEPGELFIRMDDRARFVVEGGFYNDIVINSWKTSDDHIAAKANMDAVIAEDPNTMDKQGKRDWTDRLSAAQDDFFDLESAGRELVASTHPDLLARKLAIETAWMHGSWVSRSVRSMAEFAPDDPWVIERLAQWVEFDRKRAEEAKITTGTSILDFSAVTLDGQTVKLSELVTDKKFVLVEFWASWCGPCRTEIPHMKEARERFSGQGFEIVSFTIDNERDDWVLASEEEQIPWHNLGMGEEAEAPKKYSVTGVPKNFLVDAKTMLIVTTDLRGYKLDQKLEEILL